jgi:signal peptidase II
VNGTPHQPTSTSVPIAAAGAPAIRSGYLRFWLTFGALLAADQVSKIWIVRHIQSDTYFDPPPIPVIDGFFYFVHISNVGAAWGMLPGFSTALGALAALALGAIFFFRRQLELRRPFLQYTFGLLCAGILGNLIDRMIYGHVVDFLDFHLPGYRYPAFNVADSGITVGVILYLIYSFRDSWSRRR